MQLKVGVLRGRQRPARSGVGLVALIGLLGTQPQPVLAQLPTGDGVGVPGWLAARDEPFRERLEARLLTSASRDYAAGFDLANRAGLAAVPLLRQMLLDERSNSVRRSAALAAAMIAGGQALDPWLFEWLGQQKAIKEERTMVALAIALGPPRERPVTDFWSHGLGVERSPEEILTLAVRVAAARIPGAGVGAPPLVEDEVGLAAATAFAGLPVPERIARHRWNLQERSRHGDLFWRGALLAGCRALASGGAADPDLIGRARMLTESASGLPTSALEIAWRYLAMAGLVRADGAKPDHRLLRGMAPDRAAARRVAAWLGPRPVPRDEQEPERLAVCYVLSRDPAQVFADRADWAAEARIRGHVAVALALQVLDDPQSRALEDVQLAAVPEWQLVRWACGQSVTAATCADVALTATIELAAAGRLPRPAGRRVLEAILWRWGSHPELPRFEAEQVLVRDLLLVGSDPGGKYLSHVRPEERYRPRGIDSDAFFEVAVAYYDFVRTRRPPLPPAYRLR